MKKEVIVEISARHVHVSQEHLEILFGEGYALTKKKDLSQPGQFACEEKVLVKGAKGELNCTILGPVRPATQIEVSMTEARTLGVQAPVRESGNLAGSASCTLVGPNGEIELSEGVIVAKRHIHITPNDASEFGVEDKQIVSVSVNTDDRSLVFGDVVVRVSESYATACHIDTDESNAAGMSACCMGEVII